jgi:hypothetical protein
MMKHVFPALLIVVVAVFGCMQRPAPVASETQTVAPADRPAIAVEYVQVPSMQVYERPAADSTVTGSYGLSEAISVLEVKGDWKMIRTFDGTGWVKSIDLATAEQVAKVDLAEPRFYVVPVQVPARAHGELEYQAKVNTDGSVVEVKLIKNTTGNEGLATANAQALEKAIFYPMVEKGQRKVFTYEHHVYY